MSSVVPRDGIPALAERETLGALGEAVTKKHASEDLKLHALYAHYYLGPMIKEVAELFCKSERQILRWKRRYQRTGSVARKRTIRMGKFNEEDVQWIEAHYMANPFAYLEETCRGFRKARGVQISKSRLWDLFRAAGLSWNVRL